MAKLNERFASDSTISNMLAFIEEGLVESEHQKLLKGVDEEMKKLRIEGNSLNNNLEVVKSSESKKANASHKPKQNSQKEHEHVVVMDFDDLVQYIGNNDTIASNIAKKTQAKKAKKKEKESQTNNNNKKKTLMQSSSQTSQPHKSTSKGKQLQNDQQTISIEQEEEENKQVEVFKIMLLESSVHCSFVTKAQPNFSNY